ncbi:SDR family oxidoreductase [Alkalicaulis satelles]|uniref:SDR family oxidoreductase n=1 Tax=Alkalicaulis satelles TaxID=2609175 RepID=A0A5M6ZL74_9PROT|nr:SDR family oxidoreductase [Alkalicaulis satelles]KAA5803968.1 SDR family oxidoreductase [Alkalicaulis satelles]
MPHALITGANRGLGLEHVRQLLQRGWTVTAAVRDPQGAADLKSLDPGDGRLRIEAYDASDPGAAKALQSKVSGPLDIVFANAGVMSRAGFGSAAGEDFITAMQINAQAPLALAEAFADQVARSQLKVIALQSTRMGSIADNTSGGMYAYRASKAALNAVGKSLSIDLKPKGVIVLILHPGWVKTDMGGPGGQLTVTESVEGQLDLIARANPAMSGRFFHVSGQDLPW